MDNKGLNSNVIIAVRSVCGYDVIFVGKIFGVLTEKESIRRILAAVMEYETTFTCISAAYMKIQIIKNTDNGSGYKNY